MKRIAILMAILLLALAAASSSEAGQKQFQLSLVSASAGTASFLVSLERGRPPTRVVLGMVCFDTQMTFVGGDATLTQAGVPVPVSGSYLGHDCAAWVYEVGGKYNPRADSNVVYFSG